MKINLILPYPPSINHYYKIANNRMYLGQQGKAYRQLIRHTLWECIPEMKKSLKTPFTFDLGVKLIVFPPDKRKRDIDNIKKAIYDALQYAELYKDDSQIYEEHTYKSKNIIKNGRIDLEMWRLE